ncbi:TonB-dependent receptor plug domain-containing protein [Sulfurimonas aquatica]|uniref:TonB-dependent receptor plug domain-containing protein n=1 Tax=Sulfurimonas aquatica TaxID=2672570 RepID=A0A975B291_9BACT|nr:TonB-dependent receptor [Sulfurimonas aquatica]QSZ42901.1 TonB-dependent receptor plug domain-containing protein [Sulfurimonas aquatica]
MKKTLQLSLISAALISSLSAAELTLIPIEITSTAISTDELRATDAVEVYTQEDIEKAHVQNIYEFLTTQTSIFATSAYGNPYSQKIDMRGYGVADGYQNIVVSVNGRRMNNADMVSQLLASISPSSIKKIEIIKSSGVVIAGDGANAGVINIITKESNDKEISFYMGNYNLVNGSFYLGHTDDKLSINASGELQRSEGIRDIDTDGDKDANSMATFSFNAAYRATQDLELRLGAMLTRTDVIYASTMSEQEYKENPTQQGTSYGFASNYANQKFDSNVLSAGFTYKINNELSLQTDISKEKKKSLYDIPAYGSNSRTDYDYTQFKTYLDYSNESLALKLGVDTFYAGLDYINSYNVDLAMNKENEALFIMSEFYLNDFTLKAGYRYENMNFNESGGEHESENLHGVELGANYLLNKTSSTFLNYSHGYQTASLDRMFSYFGTGYMGYVKPSQSDNYTLGYSNIQASNKLKVSLFYLSLKDEIYYYADPSFINSKNTNIDKSHKYGLDIYDNILINQELNLVLNYNYVQAIMDEEIENGEDYSGNKLPGVSNHNLKATLNYLPNKFSTLSLVQVYRSDAYAAEDFHNNFSQKQDAVYSTDISATLAKDNWEVFAKINNIFNQSNGLWIRNDAIYPMNYATTGFVGFKLKY